MDEYIKREAAIEEIIGEPPDAHYPSWYAEKIKEIPTEDVTPVRHGHWVSLTDCSNAGVYCSNCHKKVYKEDYASCNRKNKLRSNYCPNCGAKMESEG